MKQIISVLFFSTLILSGMTQSSCPPCRNQQVSTTYAVVGSHDIGTYDLASNSFTFLLTVSSLSLSRIAVTPDNQVYVTNGQAIYLVNPTQRSVFRIGIGSGRDLQSIAFGPNGVLYAIDTDNNLCEIDLTTGVASTVVSIDGYTQETSGMVWDPIDQVFYIGSDDGQGSGGQLLTLNLDGTYTLSTLQYPDYQLNGIFLDGETLYGMTSDRQLLTIDKTTGEMTEVGVMTGTTSVVNSVTRASTCETPSRRVLLARKRRLL